MFATIVERLKEPSTYAGLSVLAVTFGVSTELYTAISGALAGIFGVIAVVLKEKTPEE